MSNPLDLSSNKKKLLKALLRKQNLTPASTKPEIPKRVDHSPVPLSYGQRRLWFLDQLQIQPENYNVTLAAALHGNLHVPALKQSIEDLIARHEILHTTFHLIDGQPRQIIHDKVESRFQVVEAQTLDKIALFDHLRDIAARPFDLSQAPLLRTFLLRRAPHQHILLIVIHHICSDGWSAQVMLNEILHSYKAYHAGTRTAPPSPAIQYGDFAVWEQSRSWDDSLAYWRNQLTPPPPLVRFPTSYESPRVPAYSGAIQSRRLSPALVKRLQELSHRNQTTLFTLLLAVFKVLLYRYTGETDLAVGVPMTNRNQKELSGLIGFLVNTLVIRTRVQPADSLGRLLNDLKTQILAAFEHGDLPFDLLVANLELSRGYLNNPLFNILFTYRKLPEIPPMDDLHIELLDVHNGTAKRDFTIWCLESAAGLNLRVEYRTDVYDATRIDQILSHYHRLLQATLEADETLAIAHLPLWSKAAYAGQIDALHATSRSVSFPVSTIPALFRERAAAHPDQTAVIDTRTQLTYGELHRLSNNLTGSMWQRGIEKGTTIGIYLERSCSLVISTLGILQAGCAYVPLDVTYPRQRLRQMTAACTYVITSQALIKQLPDTVEPLVLDDMIAEPFSPVESQASAVWPDDLAYILFTSGSTGTPKGVMVEHRQILNYIMAFLDRAGNPEGGHYAMVQPLTVDSCLTMLFPPLLTGGTLHIIPYPMTLDARQLSDYMQTQAIDYLKIAPSHLAAIERAGYLPDVLPERALITGGEASNYAWFRALQTYRPGCRIFNHYGPTETTVGVTMFTEQDNGSDMGSKTTPIGTALANTRLYILDQALEPVPTGATGELYIGGLNVARGYFERPALTAAAFMPDPFSGVPGARLYRTGDFVRHLKNGVLEFVGRTDDQVKISGFRVEPGDIEDSLLACDPIRSVKVIVQEHRPDKQQLVAFVVTDGSPVNDQDLMQFLRERLPEYMIPRVFVQLDALPLTPHGKVDISALPEPRQPDRTTSQSSQLPGTHIEQTIADIWCDVLQLEQVSLFDNFFDIGGTSLLLVDLHSRLNQTFEKEIPLLALLQHTTIKAQSGLFGKESQRQTRKHERGVKQRDRIKQLQQRLRK